MLPTTLQRYLNERQAAYALEPRAFAAGADTGDAGVLARAVALADERGAVLAILPADRLLAIDLLRDKLGRALHPLTAPHTHSLFPDCEPHMWPPLAPAYGLQAVVDVSLYAQLTVRFAAGRGDLFLKCAVQEFQRILGPAVLGRFSVPLHRHAAAVAPDGPASFARHAATAADRCTDLPVFAQSALEILKLASDPHAGARDLAKVVELDTALCANILRYANSPLYGNHGKIADVQSAIARVLGFDRVLGLAIGMSIGRSFRIPVEGPLGMNAYRRNAAYCATLVQRLARMLPQSMAVHAGVAYTTGLLHNIGQLFLGHIFPREYAQLECALLANAHAAVPDVERQVLGIGHDEIAARLLHSWRLPEAIVTAIRYHHDADYGGPHAIYAHLILLANCALAVYGLGINEGGQLPGRLLHRVGLAEAEVRGAAADVWEGRAEIEALAQLVA